MNITTDDWLSCPQAAALLEVSRQRLDQLILHGAVESINPWPRIHLVRTATLRDYRDRSFQHLTARAVQQWLRIEYDIAPVDMTEPALRDALLVFIVKARPDWSLMGRDHWMLTMLPRMTVTA